MNFTNRFRSGAIALASAAVALSAGSNAKAVTYVWDNGAANNFWGDATNWDLNSGFPNAAGDVSNFAISAAGVLLANSSGADASFTTGSVLSQTGASHLNISNVASGTGVLIFDSLSGNATLTVVKNSGRTTNLNIGVVLNDDLSVTARSTDTAVRFMKAITSGSGLTTGLVIEGAGASVASSINYVSVEAASSYTGATTVNGSLSTTSSSGGGKLRITGNNFLPTTTVLTVNASNVATNAQGGRFNLNGFSQTVSGLSGSSGTAAGLVMNDSALATTGTLTINNTSNFSFGGTIGNAVTGGNLGVTALTKTGAGTQTLTGNNTYTGATVISAGTLVVGVSGTGSLGNTAVTVEANGALAGSGTIGGAVILSGTLAPGNSPGTLTINNSLTMTSTASTLIELSGTAIGQFDRVIGLTNLTLDGTITVSLLSYAPVLGDSFDLFDWSGTLDSSAFNIATDLLLPTLGGGLTWDTSDFLSNGVIEVAAIPEPTAMTLLGLGSALVLLGRRRKLLGGR